MPTESFTASNNTPETVRNLYLEAVGCLEHNFLTGASACIRLMVTELTELMELEASNHEARLVVLRDNTSANPEYFNAILSIIDIEEEATTPLSYDGWSKDELLVTLENLTKIIAEYYPA